MVFGSIGCAFIMSLRGAAFLFMSLRFCYVAPLALRFCYVAPLALRFCYVAPLALRDGLRRKEVSARQLTQRLSLVPRCGPRELAGLHNVAPAAL
jgi:hypothetical protein